MKGQGRTVSIDVLRHIIMQHKVPQDIIDGLGSTLVLHS